MTDSYSQTEQFLIFLEHEDKLTKVYQSVKSIQAENSELHFMNQQLIARVKELEKCLIKKQEQTNKNQSLKNQQLWKDVKKLDAELVEQTKSAQVNKPKQNKKEIKENLKPKHQQTCPQQTRQLKCFLTTTTPKNCKQQINPNANKPHPNGRTFGIEQRQELIEKVAILQKKLQKQEKQRKLIELQSRRVRKMNEENTIKCKRLQRLIQSREQLYQGLKHSLKQNQQNNSHHTICSYFLTESEKADQFQRE